MQGCSKSYWNSMTTYECMNNSYVAKSMSRIAAVMTFIEHNCQTFSIRSSRLSAVKCQIPSERGTKEGTGNFPGNNSISWRHFSCFKEEEAERGRRRRGRYHTRVFHFLAHRSRSRPYFWQMSTRRRPGGDIFPQSASFSQQVCCCAVRKSVEPFQSIALNAVSA